MVLWMLVCRFVVDSANKLQVGGVNSVAITVCRHIFKLFPVGT